MNKPSPWFDIERIAVVYFKKHHDKTKNTTDDKALIQYMLGMN